MEYAFLIVGSVLRSILKYIQINGRDPAFTITLEASTNLQTDAIDFCS